MNYPYYTLDWLDYDPQKPENQFIYLKKFRLEVSFRLGERVSSRKRPWKENL